MLDTKVIALRVYVYPPHVRCSSSFSELLYEYTSLRQVVSNIGWGHSGQCCASY